MLRARSFITTRSALINYRLIKNYSSVVNNPPTEKPSTPKKDYADVLNILSSTKSSMSQISRRPLESGIAKTPDSNPNSGRAELKKLLQTNKMDDKKKTEIIRHFVKLDLSIPKDGVNPLSFLQGHEWAYVLEVCRVSTPEEKVKLLEILERRFQMHKVYRGRGIVKGLGRLYSDIGNVQVLLKVSAESEKNFGISDRINIANAYAHIGQLDKAEEELSEICKDPELSRKRLVVFTYIMRAYANMPASEQVLSRLESFWKTYAETLLLATENVKSSRASLAVELMLRGYCNSKQIDKAEALIRECGEKYETTRTVGMFLELIKYYTSQNDLENLLRVFKDMINEGVKPDTRIFNCMLELYSHSKDPVNVLRIFFSMKQNRIVHDSESFKYLSKSIRPRQISANLSTIVRESGGELTPWLIYELITAHKKNIEEILQKYHQKQNPEYYGMRNTITPESFKKFPKTAFPYDTIRAPVWYSNSTTVIWKFLPQLYRNTLHLSNGSSILSRYIEVLLLGGKFDTADLILKVTRGYKDHSWIQRHIPSWFTIYAHSVNADNKEIMSIYNFWQGVNGSTTTYSDIMHSLLKNHRSGEVIGEDLLRVLQDYLAISSDLLLPSVYTDKAICFVVDALTGDKGIDNPAWAHENFMEKVEELKKMDIEDLKKIPISFGTEGTGIVEDTDTEQWKNIPVSPTAGIIEGGMDAEVGKIPGAEGVVEEVPLSHGTEDIVEEDVKDKGKLD